LRLRNWKERYDRPVFRNLKFFICPLPRFPVFPSSSKHHIFKHHILKHHTNSEYKFSVKHSLSPALPPCPYAHHSQNHKSSSPACSTRLYAHRVLRQLHYHPLRGGRQPETLPALHQLQHLVYHIVTSIFHHQSYIACKWSLTSDENITSHRIIFGKCRSNPSRMQRWPLTLFAQPAGKSLPPAAPRLLPRPQSGKHKPQSSPQVQALLHQPKLRY
jgi:hypothetical protein